VVLLYVTEHDGKGQKDLDNPPSVEEEDSMDSSIDERPDEGAVIGKGDK
jgi:hypothetical protein